MSKATTIELYEDNAGGLYWRHSEEDTAVELLDGGEDGCALTDARLWSDWAHPFDDGGYRRIPIDDLGEAEHVATFEADFGDGYIRYVNVGLAARAYLGLRRDADERGRVR